jgi:hypothetical protein
LYAVNIYVSPPAAMVAMIWGWVRWSKRAQRPTLISVLSLIGYTLATVSGLLAVSTVLYAHAIDGFGYYDPLLMTIYRWGALLSLLSFVFGLSGVWRPGPFALAHSSLWYLDLPVLVLCGDE